jgi:type I restriction enzyme M protein
MVMVTRVLPFSDLVSQGRWKVEFFLSNGGGSKSTAYPLVCLRDVLRERREALDPQEHPGNLFIYLGLEHVQPVTGDLTVGYQPREGREVLSRSKVFRRGDVLYGRLRPMLNKVFVGDERVQEGICSGEFYVLVPDTSRILPHFARALLASRYVQDVVAGMTTGSALPRLQLDDLLDIEVPLPPLEVQTDYESKLMASKERRRKLAAELFNGPAAELDAVVIALEGGTVPDFSTPAQPERLDLRETRLPSERSGQRPAGRRRY